MNRGKIEVTDDMVMAAAREYMFHEGEDNYLVSTFAMKYAIEAALNKWMDYDD